jgi:hypothetical protein
MRGENASVGVETCMRLAASSGSFMGFAPSLSDQVEHARRRAMRRLWRIHLYPVEAQTPRTMILLTTLGCCAGATKLQLGALAPSLRPVDTHAFDDHRAAEAPVR